jgi:acetyltransferase-like isoleucine patch superfamily enzyme
MISKDIIPKEIKMSAIIYPLCKIAPNVSIGEFSIIGKSSRPTNDGTKSKTKPKETIIQDNCFIGSHVTIGEGTIIEKDTAIEDYGAIEDNVTIGASSYIVHGARICSKSIIGHNCVIGGFIAERSKVGSYSRVFGMLIHKQDDPSKEWDLLEEEAPNLKCKVIVGMGAQVIGGINIEEHVYICSGAVVTKDVPSYHVVLGVNKKIPISKWKGNLKNSLFFGGSHG